MIAAEPALAGRVLRRLGVVRRSSGAPGVPPRLEAPGRDTPAGRLAAAIRTALEKGEPVVVTGCGTSEHGAQAFAAIVADAATRGGIRGRGPAGKPSSRPGVRGVAGAAAGRARSSGSATRAGPAATLAALDAAAAPAARTAAVTVQPASPIGRLADRAGDRARSTGAGATRSATSPRSSPPWRWGRPSRASRATPTRRCAGAPRWTRARAGRQRRRRSRATLGRRARVVVVASGVGPAGRRASWPSRSRRPTWLPTTHARPRDVPPRPPSGDGRGDRHRAHPRRPRRAGGAVGAGPAGDGGGGAAWASGRRRSSPRSWTPSGRRSCCRRAGSSSPEAPALPAPSPRWSGRQRRSRCSPSGWPGRAARTPTRSGATSSPTAKRPTLAE